jgi:hypothetical protein
MLKVNLYPDTLYLAQNEAFEITREGPRFIAKGPVLITVDVGRFNVATVSYEGKRVIATIEEDMEVVVKTPGLKGYEVSFSSGYQSCYVEVKSFDLTFEEVETKEEVKDVQSHG